MGKFPFYWLGFSGGSREVKSLIKIYYDNYILVNYGRIWEIKVWNMELEDERGSCQPVALEAECVQMLQQIQAVMEGSVLPVVSGIH